MAPWLEGELGLGLGLGPGLGLRLDPVEVGGAIVEVGIAAGRLGTSLCRVG